MRVKDAANVLTEAKQLFICWEGSLMPFDPKNELMMAAYGDFEVKRICNTGDTKDGEYEIAIASIPVKEAQA